MVPVGGVLTTIGGDGGRSPAPAQAPAQAAEPAAATESGELERRATDKKGPVKHTTGEYAEAIEMKGPRVDRAAAPPTVAPVAQPAEGGRQRSSPLARRMARDMGVNLEQVQGSGPGGRVVASDIRSAQGGAGPQRTAGAMPAAENPVPALKDQQIPLSAMRRTIAKRLAESTGPIPHFYLTSDP